MHTLNPVLVALLWAGGVLAATGIVFGFWILAGGRVAASTLRSFGSRSDAGLYYILFSLAVLLLDLSSAPIARDSIVLGLALMGASALCYVLGVRHRPRTKPDEKRRGWRHPLVRASIVAFVVLGTGVLFASAGYWNWW